MSFESEEKLDALLTEMPKLHNWGGQWSSGGMWPDLIRTIMKYAFENGAEKAHILETGVGLSTLAFLTAEPSSLNSFAIEPDLISRVTDEAERRSISTAPAKFHVGASEILLPRFALDRDPFVTFAFIDGGHNFPTVWCDFTYINYILLENGILAVDDTQLFSCKTLALYLKSNQGFETLHKGKTWIFRKKTGRRLEADFGASRYILENSLA